MPGIPYGFWEGLRKLGENGVEAINNWPRDGSQVPRCTAEPRIGRDRSGRALWYCETCRWTSEITHDQPDRMWASDNKLVETRFALQALYCVDEDGESGFYCGGHEPNHFVSKKWKDVERHVKKQHTYGEIMEYCTRVRKAVKP